MWPLIALTFVDTVEHYCREAIPHDVSTMLDLGRYLRPHVSTHATSQPVRVLYPCRPGVPHGSSCACGSGQVHRARWTSCGMCKCRGAPRMQTGRRFQQGTERLESRKQNAALVHRPD